MTHRNGKALVTTIKRCLAARHEILAPHRSGTYVALNRRGGIPIIKSLREAWGKPYRVDRRTSRHQ